MNFGNIESGNVSIKVLTTNNVSLTLLTDPKFNGKVIQPEAQANRVSGEHGLALSITIKKGDEEELILIDAGGLLGTIIENSKQLGVKLNEAAKLILTHGHFDHFGSLNQVIPLLKKGCELLIHPNCYQQFYSVIAKTGEVFAAKELPTVIKERKKDLAINRKLPRLNKNLIAKLAEEHEISLTEITEPMKLSEGITTSGEIELFDPEEVTTGIYIQKNRKEFEENTFRDETSLYINIKDKGLVVITGCGHTGIMNTIKHGQKLTGIDKVYAVIGGFHEEWNPIDKVKQKVDFINSLNPEVVCGMHCTGFTFNKLMSDYRSHTLGVVGTEFNL
ncbi:MAG: MBL fold metallo-hydrolase [Promethearchaeota archaeon]